MSEAEPLAEPLSLAEALSLDQPVHKSNPTTAPAPVSQGTIDQRREPRYKIGGDAEVTVAGGSSLLRGRIVNLSASGCYIQTIASLRLEPGTSVEIQFKVDSPEMGRKLLRVDSEVRFYRPKVGLGFRFLQMDPPTREILTAILLLLNSTEDSLDL